MNEIIKFLKKRRSVTAKKMLPGEVTDMDLNDILECALRVPDHGALSPWKLVVIQNDIRKTIDSINDIFCELSIWDEKIVIRSIANDNYDLKKTLNYILKSIIHDKLPKNWNL